ncbi:hypothetical protein XENTR_v10017690 [Xenopus tropicalis]|nr:hypothetical protein XENTR_v10017666 [Xenopus tropicalis]KAE8589669.1 hypothetical protein XENTR_v10017690 [Xenopus tropicalis]
MGIETPSDRNANVANVESDSELSGAEQNKYEENGNVAESSITEARLHSKAKRRLRKNSPRDSGRGDSVSDNGESTRVRGSSRNLSCPAPAFPW